MKPLSHIHSIELDINNGRTMQLAQQDYNGTITFTTYATKEGAIENEMHISPGDMVMLLNYYRYIKGNNIKCDFINPTGIKEAI